MGRFAGTLRRCENEILDWHTNDGARNGATEANLAVKSIRRAGRGIRNVTHCRLRLLAHAGGINWQDQPAARLGARPPRSAA